MASDRAEVRGPTSQPTPNGVHAGFDVLLVCTANRCRSPMAEFLLHRALAQGAIDWTVGSAGTHAVADQPMMPASIGALAELGIDSSKYRSRPLTAQQIDQADLILAAQVAHRREIVRLVPRAVGRTFTLLQFARLAERVEDPAYATSGQAGRALLAGALAARSTVQPSAPGEDDIADPAGRPLRAHRACATRIDDAISRMLTPLSRRPQPVR